MFDDADREFVAVVNDEGQFSLWPVDRAPPEGWREAGGRGNKAECLAFIEQTWTDMRPRSLREKMDS